MVHHAGPRRADVASATVLLGESTVESQYDSLAAGQAEAFRLQAGASGPAQLAHVYIGSSNAATTVIVGLYSNANGHPGSLLSTGSAPASKPGTWTTAPIAKIELVSGRTYWLAVLGRGGTLRYRDRWRGPCPSETSAQVSLGALPASWRTGTLYTDCPVSAYVTVGEPAPPPPPPPPVPPAPTEEPAPPPPLASPVNTALPSIAGTATEGQVLGASSGTWSGSPTSYAYRWEACNALGEGCLDVAGATASSYKLTAGDVGGTLRVAVTATNATGSGSATSSATATVSLQAPANTALPTVSGTVLQGETLSASTGTWSGSPSSFAYQWQECNSVGGGCANVSGATGSSYKLAAGDAGHTLRTVVTATNAGGSTSASSAATATVVPLAPANTALPSISGSAAEGETLSANTGSWSGSPTSFAYQWQDCNASGESCSNVSGATSATYKAAEGDLGHTMRVVVTATNAGGSGSATSPATAIVLPHAPVNTALPTVSG
ncbi:MAG TPA: choice-of-anchor R domain-containing protein, partial [Solirubrobacteraceae bacterium]|nr:choice-of-anchor R domain-containing protein [Solirubrobacteraceae bacterium]